MAAIPSKASSILTPPLQSLCCVFDSAGTQFWSCFTVDFVCHILGVPLTTCHTSNTQGPSRSHTCLKTAPARGLPKSNTLHNGLSLGPRDHRPHRPGGAQPHYSEGLLTTASRPPAATANLCKVACMCHFPRKSNFLFTPFILALVFNKARKRCVITVLVPSGWVNISPSIEFLYLHLGK